MSQGFLEMLGWAVFIFAAALFLFREWFALHLAFFLAGLWNFFSERLDRSSEPVFPADSLPEFPKGIPPLGEPRKQALNPQDIEDNHIEDPADQVVS